MWKLKPEKVTLPWLKQEGVVLASLFSLIGTDGNDHLFSNAMNDDGWRMAA